MADEKDVFTEKKEVVTRLYEPYKFSVKAHRTQKEQGHYIEFTFNTDAFGVDTIDDDSGVIVIAIDKLKTVIERDLNSKYLGVVRTDENA
jgi:gluconate kinase